MRRYVLVIDAPGGTRYVYCDTEEQALRLQTRLRLRYPAYRGRIVNPSPPTNDLIQELDRVWTRVDDGDDGRLSWGALPTTGEGW